MDDISDIEEFYQREALNEDLRLERHQLEYELTWRYFDRYLPPQGRILEIGAATGRYTVELARRDYQITAVDLSQAELDICRTRLAEMGLLEKVQFFIADARDLTSIEGAEFDAA